MTDLARLGIVIDTTQVKEAREALEKLTKVGGETETRIGRAASALKTLGDNAEAAHKEMRELSTATQEAAKAIDGVTDARREIGKASNEGSKGINDLNDGVLSIAENVLSGKSVVEAFTEQLGELGPEGRLAAVAVQAVAFAFDQASESMKWADDLQSKADSIGVTAEYLQEIGFAAKQTHVDIGTLQSSLQGLNGMLLDIKSGAADGSVADALAQLHIDRSTIAGMSDASELIPVLADRLRAVGSQAEQVEISKKLQIQELLPLLRQGSAGLEDLRENSHKLGTVIDNETVRALAEMNGKVDEANQRIDVSLKKAFVDLAPIIVAASTALANFAQFMTQKLPTGEGTVGGTIFKLVTGDYVGAAMEGGGQKIVEQVRLRDHFLHEAYGRGLTGKAANDYADHAQADYNYSEPGSGHGGMRGHIPVPKLPKPHVATGERTIIKAIDPATESARQTIDAQARSIETFGMSSREIERWTAQQEAAVAPTDTLREKILAQDAALQKLEETADAKKAQDDAASETAKRLADDAERRDRFVSQSLKSQSDETELARASLSLAGATTQQRADELDILRLKQDMLAAGVQAESAEGQQLLANERANQRITTEVQRATAYHDEIRQTEQDAFHSVTNLIKQGDTAWDDWKKAGLSALQTIIAKALELKVLNPLENKLFGTNLPTEGDGSGSLFNDFANRLGNWFDGGGSSSQGTSTMDSAMASTTQLANGTNFHRGGPAIINDGGGPEVVQLPRGSRVFTAMQSREMVQQAKASPEIDLNAAAAVLAKVLAGHMAKVGNDAKTHADRNLNSYDRNLNRRMPALQRMGT